VDSTQGAFVWCLAEYNRHHVMNESDESDESDMQRLICFGDSITQGHIGSAYVERIAAALPGVDVVNAGIDGDTTLNLARRIDADVIARQPSLVSIMVGLNDFGTAYGERLSRAYYRTLKRVPIIIDIPTFEALYTGLITRLQRAHIPVVLMTPTTLGEVPDTPGQMILDGYVQVIHTLAMRWHVPVIDVRAAFVQAMRNNPRPGPEYHLWMVPLDQWRISRGSSYQSIAQQRGFDLLVDGVHLSAQGADLVAQTALPTLRQLLTITASVRP